MRPDKFTAKMQEALNAALDLASKNDNPEITNEHFLLALVEQPDGLTRPLLEKLGVSAPTLEARLADVIAGFSKARGGSQPQLSNELSIECE